MSFRTVARKASPLVYLLAGACFVTRPVPIVADAPGISAFLSEHPRADLRVTEHSGERYWVHRRPSGAILW